MQMLNSPWIAVIDFADSTSTCGLSRVLVFLHQGRELLSRPVGVQTLEMYAEAILTFRLSHL